MNYLNNATLLGLSALLTFSAYSAEVDSFTDRYVPVKDSLEQINAKTDSILKEALVAANKDLKKKKLSCSDSEKRFYKSMRPYFKTVLGGKLAKWIVGTDELDKIITPIERSIYRDFKWYEAVVPGAFARVIKDPSAPMMKVNGVMIGTDKFEHFLGSGYLYFKRNYLKGKGVLAAMQIGINAESGYMGAGTTGVQAFGDLTANFNGMRFWNHMLQKRDDILGPEYNYGPYVSCVDDKWVQVKKINWANYIDNAFDEGINCSRFNKKKLLDKVMSRIAKIERNDPEGRRFACPIEPDKTAGLVDKYGKFSEVLLNFEGHGVK